MVGDWPFIQALAAVVGYPQSISPNLFFVHRSPPRSMRNIQVNFGFLPVNFQQVLPKDTFAHTTQDAIIFVKNGAELVAGEV